MGAVLGGLLGSQVSGNGARTVGTILGAGLGAVIGHQVAKNDFKCMTYPKGIVAHVDYRWVQADYGGCNHQYDVCREPDGVWRPSRLG